MSRAVPSTAYALPPPLHRVLVVDTAFAQFRILFRERSTGDWMIWSAFNTEKQRNNRYIKAIRENRDIEFATQDHTSPIDAASCQQRSSPSMPDSSDLIECRCSPTTATKASA